MIKDELLEEDTDNGQPLPMRYRLPVEYLRYLRPYAPNGTSLLVEGETIRLNFPPHLQHPDVVINLDKQEQFIWTWKSLGTIELGGEVVHPKNAEYKALEVENVHLKEKHKAKTRVKDEDFMVLAQYVSDIVWKQLKQKMKVKLNG
jgi:hypothetical protein